MKEAPKVIHTFRGLIKLFQKPDTLNGECEIYNQVNGESLITIGTLGTKYAQNDTFFHELGEIFLLYMYLRYNNKGDGVHSTGESLFVLNHEEFSQWFGMVFHVLFEMGMIKLLDFEGLPVVKEDL